DQYVPEPGVVVAAARGGRAARPVRAGAAAPPGVRGALRQPGAARQAGPEAAGLAAARGVRRAAGRAGLADRRDGQADQGHPGAPGPGDRADGDRRVAVDAGRGRRAQPAGGGAGGGEGVRLAAAAADQPGAGHVLRHRLGGGRADHRPGLGGARDRQPGAGRADRDRRGGVLLAGRDQDLPVPAAGHRRRRGGRGRRPGPDRADVGRVQHLGPQPGAGGRGRQAVRGAGVHDRLRHRHRLHRAGGPAGRRAGRPRGAARDRRRHRRQLLRRRVGRGAVERLPGHRQPDRLHHRTPGDHHLVRRAGAAVRLHRRRVLAAVVQPPAV
ncbi:MAG: Aerotolerance protein BatA, partial [uncultured Corynebacteriales bacterium]